MAPCELGRDGERPLMRSARHTWEPYQFRTRGEDDTQITGLDVERIRTVFEFPVLLEQTVGQRWFLGLEILGTVAFAASGVLRSPLSLVLVMGMVLLAFLLTRLIPAGRRPSPWWG